MLAIFGLNESPKNQASQQVISLFHDVGLAIHDLPFS
jgi:hypothetical protein